MNKAILDYYRCPEGIAEFSLAGELSPDAGFFRFGPEAVCYGQSAAGRRSARAGEGLYDVFADVSTRNARAHIPFDPNQVIDNLRLERYVHSTGGWTLPVSHTLLGRAYYFARKLLPDVFRRHIQKTYFRGWQQLPFPSWPVDTSVESLCESLLALSMKVQGPDRVPFIWFWPEGAMGCVVMTHDVETAAGRDHCSEVMDLDDSFGVKASFQIVPEQRYSMPESFLESIRNRGFEVGLQDLNHDGLLFSSRAEFLRRVRRINEYAKAFRAEGFRAAVLYRNVDWLADLEVSYDLSMPSVGHLEVQRGGCCTVMPYFIGHLVEIPLTTTQDYSLFTVLNDYSIDLWKRQLELILGKHGLASFIVHPDYVIEARPRKTFAALLEHLAKLRAERNLWQALPREVNAWWRQRAQMRLVEQEGRWRIEGAGNERARIAWASLDGDRVVYSVERSESRKI
jgi:hypothetical protein